MVTLHPTSSKRPWIQNPHLHAVALWADMDENGAVPLSWANEKGPLDIEALRESWGKSYEGSTVVHASYFTADENGLYSRPPSRGKRSRQSLASALRYDLRPFQEDAWAALAARRLGVPGGSMRELLNPWRKTDLEMCGRCSRFRTPSTIDPGRRRSDVASLSSRPTIRGSGFSRIFSKGRILASPGRNKSRRPNSDLRLSRVRFDSSSRHGGGRGR